MFCSSCLPYTTSKYFYFVGNRTRQLSFAKALLPVEQLKWNKSLVWLEWDHVYLGWVMSEWKYLGPIYTKFSSRRTLGTFARETFESISGKKEGKVIFAIIFTLKRRNSLKMLLNKMKGFSWKPASIMNILNAVFILHYYSTVIENLKLVYPFSLFSSQRNGQRVMVVTDVHFTVSLFKS